MSGVLDGLFKNLEDTFESSVKKIKTAGESADRVADGVEKLVSSFDEHEVRAPMFLRGTLRPPLNLKRLHGVVP